MGQGLIEDAQEPALVQRSGAGARRPRKWSVERPQSVALIPIEDVAQCLDATCLVVP